MQLLIHVRCQIVTSSASFSHDLHLAQDKTKAHEMLKDCWLWTLSLSQHSSCRTSVANLKIGEDAKCVRSVAISEFLDREGVLPGTKPETCHQ